MSVCEQVLAVCLCEQVLTAERVQCVFVLIWGRGVYSIKFQSKGVSVSRPCISGFLLFFSSPPPPWGQPLRGDGICLTWLRVAPESAKTLCVNSGGGSFIYVCGLKCALLHADVCCLCRSVSQQTHSFRRRWLALLKNKCLGNKCAYIYSNSKKI